MRFTCKKCKEPAIYDIDEVAADLDRSRVQAMFEPSVNDAYAYLGGAVSRVIQTLTGTCVECARGVNFSRPTNGVNHGG